MPGLVNLFLQVTTVPLAERTGELSILGKAEALNLGARALDELVVLYLGPGVCYSCFSRSKIARQFFPAGVGTIVFT